MLANTFEIIAINSLAGSLFFLADCPAWVIEFVGLMRGGASAQTFPKTSTNTSVAALQCSRVIVRGGMKRNTLP